MAEKNLPQLIKDVASDVSRLAKLEAQQLGQHVAAGVRKRAIAAGIGISGLVLLAYGVLFLLAAAAAALALVFAWWLALLIVGGGIVVIALLMAAVAASAFRRAGPLVPQESKDSIKEDLQWLAGRTS